MAAYNFDKKFTTTNFSVDIDTKQHYGYFEHDELGEDMGGGLWFTGLKLVDYDGVFELPQEVTDCLREHGYIVGEEFDED